MHYQNILLIDDDEEDQEIFLSAVTQVSGHVQCIVVTHAAKALQKLSSKEIMADVIFLDLNMPLMNGQEFLFEIKKNPELKHIPVIIFTTSSHAETILVAKKLGAADFITKPEKYDDLVNILTPLIS